MDDGKRGLEENVASLLRRGYGGQDVEMLPSPNPISNERSGSMKLKWQKEMKWLLLAALAFLFLFERSDTLTVQDGYVRLCRRTWWFYKREVKSAEVSSIENVTHISKWGRDSKLDSLLLKDKSGRVFYELHYSGFKIGANWWKEAHSDEKVCKSAIAGKGKFSREVDTVSPIPYAILIVSLVVYVYKRSWRVAREREESK